MKTKVLLYLALCIISGLLASCFKQPDIPDTTTDIEGTITDATTGDSMANYNVVLVRAPIADKGSTLNTIDTTVATDTKGHYKIAKKLDYYKTRAYMLNAEWTLKYAPITDQVEVTVGIKNIFNFKIQRQQNYVVINGVVSDSQNNKLSNIRVSLYNLHKQFNSLVMVNDTLTNIAGNFHFEYEWSDTLQDAYKIIVLKTDKYQASDDYWVKWGVDNYFNIVLNPLK